MNSWYYDNLLNVQTALLYIPLVLGVQISIRAGIFSLAPVGFFAAAAYAGAAMALHGWSIALATIVPVLASLVIASFMAPIIASLRGLYLGLVTFAMALLVGVIATNGGELTGGSLGLFAVPLGTSTLELVLTAVFFLAAAWRIERSSIGRIVAALDYSEELTSSVGVDVPRMRSIIFVLSCGCGATSGVLYVLTLASISPTVASFGTVISVLTMAIVGGIGRWYGAPIGIIFVTWLPIVLSSVGTYRNLVEGAVLALVAMYAPSGIAGLVHRAAEVVSPRLWGVIRRPAPFVGANSMAVLDSESRKEGEF